MQSVVVYSNLYEHGRVHCTLLMHAFNGYVKVFYVGCVTSLCQYLMSTHNRPHPSPFTAQWEPCAHSNLEKTTALNTCIAPLFLFAYLPTNSAHRSFSPTLEPRPISLYIHARPSCTLTISISPPSTSPSSSPSSVHQRLLHLLVSLTPS